ncbi:hypothetical protein M5X00_10455 [Paenibacillus alvei]|uniref:Uncharacterized protein n=1 Tax=Paenibacillus alvei TaxID=44250 RepID=A0ABT4GTF6_PAEAL|nr:hypothetical protein [Paenibacillus alvei]EJW17884.1 hypothetical protein PAV_3c03330 [Paenibacillus alvei DSM 29]MCY9544390.1 hypothetical protein [Paenibacillus alvei]MCY9703390.1 hypothetical protein [Paenibacillus alvei]MCY9738274.1 hypothetical protein [Paenibacillus alvei]MCY9754671.1 hypothetical protein [Paenibacillus alvei]
MKRSMGMVMSAALLMGGTMATWGTAKVAQAVAGHHSSATVSNQKLSIVKEYGGASIELEAVEKTEKGIQFAIVKKFPEGIKKEIADQVMWMNNLVMDDKGWIYDLIDKEDHPRLLEDNTTAWVMKATVASVRKDAKKLIVKSYVGGNYDDKSSATAEKANVMAKLNGTFPVTIDQGKIGELQVTGLKKEKDKTILQLSIAGDTASIQHTGVFLVQNGKRLDLKEAPKLVGVKNGIYQYELTFPAVANKANLSVLAKRMTPVEFLKELELTIELDQHK